MIWNRLTFPGMRVDDDDDDDVDDVGVTVKMKDEMKCEYSRRRAHDFDQREKQYCKLLPES